MGEAVAVEGPWTENPDMVQVYDVENSGMWDHEFYAALIEEKGARRISDIGCGTGVLGVELARRGLQVTGVDPAAAMIEAARSRPGGETVTWIQGTAERLRTAVADFAVMEGHVAQYFLPRGEWDEVLRQAHRNLVPGGWLAFETRNPQGLELDAWDAEHTRETQPHPDGGEFTSWVELAAVDEASADAEADGPLITHRGHTVLPDGRHLVVHETLRYRSLPTLIETLAEAGFAVAEIWGDWDREELHPDSPEIIILAQKL
ncbi:class I SAM-dependent methyltransferase [Nesterenkonia sp. HG001]|uniref:class I SAM-dependent methyltransferase n=1 Tax=Nesterenkonia sp. HG001 TaxID=2983207 RepID=UPI002AC56543|nr:class I SAM-dependent methyltransferase [Nesterenkonia sp. HG001]MDZ5078965.1 class I SAM-dependent methyltransferase [Nesterenkonia sp. HG001]